MRDANMSYIGMTSRHLVTRAQEHLHSTMKLLLHNILIHAHLVVAVTLALVALKYFNNAITIIKRKFKHY